MAMLRTKRSQAAQGMAEFALVLPFLLLILLGIIAFGHLFFVYSFTVASSREAARWGAAAGLTDSGLHRFEDCASIREAARRVGGIIGVTPGAVSISFDKGPDTTVYATCPVGGKGPDVKLGDRIIVTVNITYQPIVPLVNLPTIPLQGITARTVIRDLEVGDAPTAVPLCVLTVPKVIATTSPLDVNSSETFSYQVQAKNAGDPNPTASDGYVDIYIDGTKLTLTKAMSGTFSHDFKGNWGDHAIRVDYVSAHPDKFCSSSMPYTFFVRYPSKVNILSDSPDPSQTDQKFTVQVEVLPLPTGIVFTPTGAVTVVDSLHPTTNCLVTLDPTTGKGSCDFLSYTYVGAATLIAKYDGDSNFGPSQVSEPHTVTGIATPTLIPTPEPDLYCPTMNPGTYNFSAQTNAFYLTINNTANWKPATITRVTVTWPQQPGVDALLQEIRLATDTSDAAAKCNLASPSSSCLWGTTNPLSPDYVEIGASPTFLSSADTTIPAFGSKQLRMVFLGNLPDTNPSNKSQTKYQVLVNFTLGNGTTCQLVGPISERGMIP